MVDITKEFKLICKSIPTYKLCDDIGVDAETTYILDLTTEENIILQMIICRKIAQHMNLLTKDSSVKR